MTNAVNCRHCTRRVSWFVLVRFPHRGMPNGEIWHLFYFCRNCNRRTGSPVPRRTCKLPARALWRIDSEEWIEHQRERKDARMQQPELFDGPPIRQHSTADDDHKITPEELLAMWNEAAKAHGMRTGQGLGGDRLVRLRKLFKEQPYASYWREVIARICDSDFCKGLVPGKDFLAGFDFLTRLHTHIDVLEGKYDTRQNQTREQFRAHQRHLHNRSLHGRSVTIITEDQA